MKRKTIGLVVTTLMSLSLVLAACAPATPTTPGAPATPSTPTTPTTPSTPTAPTPGTPQQPAAPATEKPQYGGMLRLGIASDITIFDDIVTVGFGPGLTNSLTNETMWTGDWAKGPAGGFGTKESDWVGVYDVFENHAGLAAESWKWNIDAATDTGTLVYQIRQGVHFGLNPKSEASKLVAGREMTTDDVLFSLKQVMGDPRSYMYRAYPELRDVQITKTGPQEITIKTSTSAGLITAVAKFGSYVRIVPPEVVAKYGDMSKWYNAVGTGPFLLSDMVPGSQATLPRNPTYWKKNPVGPGQGDQVPYIDAMQYIIMPDASTRQAALRTGKIDRMANLAFEDAGQMKKTAPKLVEAEGTTGGPTRHIAFNSQKAPFNDVRVRRALLMSVDLESVKDNLNSGKGQILTWPYEFVGSYKDLYLGLDDPEMPASVKELYTYSPDKAKQLLKEAGFPNGLKATALIGTNDVDYFSIIKDMWAKVGVDLSLDVKQGGTLTTARNAGQYDITTGSKGPISVFYHHVHLVGQGPAGGNVAQVNDPAITKWSDEMQRLYLVDAKQALKLYKDGVGYVLDQAFVVPGPNYPQTTFWWPWLKNYSGEQSVGYFMYDSWATWVWIDQALKKSMGY